MVSVYSSHSQQKIIQLVYFQKRQNMSLKSIVLFVFQVPGSHTILFLNIMLCLVRAVLDIIIKTG